MTTTTNVEQVKLNIMTTSQYDNSSKSDTELYVLTDATAMPMDDELSLSSENPVKNNVITARSNQIQTELNDKLNKSTVWNKLNRAYGWTYRKQLSPGSARIIVGTTGYGFVISESIPCYEVLNPENINELCCCVCLDNTLYTIGYSNQNITLSQQYNNVTCFGLYTSNSNGFSAVSDGNLIFNKSLKDSGGWTKISSYQFSTGEINFGIKNDNLYYVSNHGSNIVLKDSSGIWSNVRGYANSSYGGLGIKDGNLYLLTTNGPVLLSNETGWDLSYCRIVPLSSTSEKCYIIKDLKLYEVDGYNKLIFLKDDTEQWIKINNQYGLTASGKIYYIYSGTITQIGSDTTWSDISNGNVAVNNGDAYMLNGSATPKRMTTTGDITKVYGTVRTSESSSFFGNCVCWSGNAVEDIHNVYTVASPSIGFYTYSNTNLLNYGTITSINSSPYSITDEHYTYNRNASIDGVFTGISPDSSKQLMSMKDFLNCFTE